MYCSGFQCDRTRLSLGESPYVHCTLRRSPCFYCCMNYTYFAVYRSGLRTLVFYGLKQSASIRRSGVRKVVLDDGIRCDGRRYSESGLSGEVLGGYGGSCLGGRREGSERGRRRKVKCLVSGEERAGDRFSRIESAEAVISLLGEEMGEESNRVSRDITRVRKKRNDSDVPSKSKGRRKKLGADAGKNERRCKVESIETDAADADVTEENRKERWREVFPRQGNRGKRKEGSSCSSYHSVFSSGNYEDDVEEVNRDEFSGEASGRHFEESRKVKERKMKKEMLEGHEQHEEIEKKNEVVRQKRASESSLVDWDRRKKSEKMHSKVSSKDVESSMKLVQEQSTASRTAGREDVGPSRSHVPFFGYERKSTAGITIDARTENHHKHKETEVNIVDEPVKTIKKAAKFCKSCGSDVQLLSQTERQQHIRRKEDTVVSGVSVAERINERDGRKAICVTTEREKFFRNPHELSVELDIQRSNSEGNTISSGRSSAGMNSTLVEEKQRQRFGMNEMVHGEEHLGESKQLSKHKEPCYGVQRTSPPQIHDTKNSPRYSKFASSMTENQIIQTPPRHPDIQIGKHYREGSSALINQSVVRTANTRSFSSYERISNETAINNNNFTSVVVLPDEAQEKDNQTGGRDGSIESSADQLGFLDDISSETAARQDFDLKCRSRTRNADRKDNKAPFPSNFMSPPSQFVQTESSLMVRTDAMQEGRYVLNSDTSISYEGADNSSLLHGYDNGQVKYQRHGHPLFLSTDGGALESALCLDEASEQFVGEFMDQTKHVANSHVHVSDAALGGEGRFDGKSSSSEIVSEGSVVEVRENRNMSEGPVTKDPADDICHGTNTYIPEVSKSESPEGLPESGNAIVKRSGGNLWKIIGDLFQLRWGSVPSTVHFGRRNSSSVSVRSETWFSGHEAEENIDIIAKSQPPEAAAKHLQPVCMSTGDRVDTKLSDREQVPKAEISLPFMAKNDSASSSNKGFMLNNDNVVSPLVTAGLFESSLSLPEKGMITSVDVTSSSGEVKVYGGGSLHRSDESGNMLVDATGLEGKNGQLKQRKKLQRKQQLPRDRFDEWEEAYQLEHEQRRIDEMFMREALLEAKKAGDEWEVPVGAVLVRHGKIIARGYNLVEELRDSTAHAEMICIREASNVLNSWRLAETTLYVTLEPCAMCAGAILQARVDTLVWGAPNKLLGADGSYVRLFPAGEDGDGSGAMDKAAPAPPVHPFHPKMIIRRGVLASECADTMQKFFQLRRRKKENRDEPTTPPSGLAVSHHPSELLDKMYHVLHVLFCL